jgi:hypothetical protein
MGKAMTEQEWLASDNPEGMLRHLKELDGGVRQQAGHPGRQLTARKMQLLACAYCRQVWHLLTDERARRAVEVAERFADGEVTEAERDQADFRPRPLSHSVPGDSPALASLRAAIACHSALASAAARTRKAWERSRKGGEIPTGGVCPDLGSHMLTSFYAAVAYARGSGTENVAGRAQATVVRDLFNHFRQVAADPSWLAWNDGTVVKLAQVIYDQRALPSGELDPARLAVLADALEEACCTDADILAHCRGPGPHVRGCWVVDRLLQKE